MTEKEIHMLGKNKMTFQNGKLLGYGINYNKSSNNKKNIFQKLLKYNSSYLKLSLDNMNAYLIKKSLNSLYKKYKCEKKDAYIAIIGHPKAFTGMAYENLKAFIDLIRNDNKKFDFVTFNEIAK